MQSAGTCFSPWPTANWSGTFGNGRDQDDLRMDYSNSSPRLDSSKSVTRSEANDFLSGRLDLSFLDHSYLSQDFEPGYYVDSQTEMSMNGHSRALHHEGSDKANANSAPLSHLMDMLAIGNAKKQLQFQEVQESRKLEGRKKCSEQQALHLQAFNISTEKIDDISGELQECEVLILQLYIRFQSVTEELKRELELRQSLMEKLKRELELRQMIITQNLSREEGPCSTAGSSHGSYVMNGGRSGYKPMISYTPSLSPIAMDTTINFKDTRHNSILAKSNSQLLVDEDIHDDKPPSRLQVPSTQSGVSRSKSKSGENLSAVSLTRGKSVPDEKIKRTIQREGIESNSETQNLSKFLSSPSVSPPGRRSPACRLSHPQLTTGEVKNLNTSLKSESHQGQIKTELCKNWEEIGSCPYSTYCKFAHGVRELRPVIRHPLYKTQACRMLMEGKECIYKHRCHFRHILTDDEKFSLLNEKTI